MNPDTGGQSVSERQRQAAAEIARKNTLAAYSSYQPKATTPAQQTQQAARNAASEAQRAQWQRYHSAWQSYYQKYYSDYYSRAARSFVDGEKAKLAQEKARLAEQQLAKEQQAAAEIAQAEKRAELAQQFAVENSLQSADNSEEDREETKNIFIKRLKARAEKKAAGIDRRRPLRRFAPLIAGALVILLLLFLQYNRLIFAPLAAYVSPGEAPSSEISAVDPTITSSVSADPKLIIPKLNIEVPVAFGIPLSEVDNAMNNGVAQFRIQGASAYPGEIGNTVITGHSAGDIYSFNQYKFIFSGLERLSVGDLIYINYNSTRYTYRMTSSAVVEPTDMTALTQTIDKPQLILVTCTPLGTSRYRLLIYAEQISPSYADSEIAEDTADTGMTEVLPQNNPTFFENVWGWLTGN